MSERRVRGVTEHAPGLCSVHGGLLNLDRRLDALFVRWADELGATEYRFPQFLAAEHLERLQYFESFPHLATFAVSLSRDRTSLEAFTKNCALDDAGGISLGETQPVTHVVTPAACYHVYVELEGSTLDAPRITTTRATCSRREDHYIALERQWTFSMREIVCVGTSEEVNSFLEHSAARVTRFVENLRLDAVWKGATDPFFDPKKNPKYVFQKLEPVKHELIFDGRLAIASTNDHRTYFGEAFSLTRGGQPLSSGCLAFGVERWLSAFVQTWGDDPLGWPDLEEAGRG